MSKRWILPAFTSWKAAMIVALILCISLWQRLGRSPSCNSGECDGGGLFEEGWSVAAGLATFQHVFVARASERDLLTMRDHSQSVDSHRLVTSTCLSRLGMLPDPIATEHDHARTWKFASMLQFSMQSDRSDSIESSKKDDTLQVSSHSKRSSETLSTLRAPASLLLSNVQQGPTSAPGNLSKTNATAVQEERSRYNTLTFVVLPVCILLAVLFEWFHKRWSEVDFNVQLDRTDCMEGSERVDNTFVGLTLGLFRRASVLCRIYFSGAGRIKGRAYVLMLIGHNLFGMQYMSLINFDFTRRMWNIYQSPSQAMFVALITNWVILYTVMTLTAVYSAYIEAILKIHWREHMTRYFEAIWLPNSYAFKLKGDSSLDNPDQRIQEDVTGFVNNTYSLTLGLWNAVFDLAIYGYMLFMISPTSFFGYMDIPGWLLYAAVAYAVLGSLVMHSIGANLAHYDWLTERYGGDFRAELRRVFEQSETMSAVRSHDNEFARLQSRFENVKLVAWRSMILTKSLNWFHHFYTPFSSIFFMCILMPFFIRGEIDLGRIKQCEMALGHVSSALNFFVVHYGGLASFRATVDRLYNFRASALEVLEKKAHSCGEPKPGEDGALDFDRRLIEELAVKGLPANWPVALGGCGNSKLSDAPSLLAMSVPATDEAAKSTIDGSEKSGSEWEGCEETSFLELKGVCVNYPSGETLLEDVSICIPPGKGVIICGREGAGKSTLLRTLAGIWPFVGKAGTRRVDGGSLHDIILIPQKPRLPTAMSLRDAVSFPLGLGTFSDAEIRAALKQTGLDDLAGSDLEAMIDVNSVLSGGEFQRLMVSHCLLAKPRWILLDEAMAHLSRENQLAMYTLLRSELVDKCGSTFISSTHDVNFLPQFHDLHFMIQIAGDRESGCCTRRLVEVQPSSESWKSHEEEISCPDDSIDSLRLKLEEVSAENKKLRRELGDLHARA